MSRLDELTGNLDAVRRRIRTACESSGRAPDDVALVVVTKFFPASDVRILADLGVTDVGENRHQEAEAKAAECADLGLRWHFIGGLQSQQGCCRGVLRRRRRVASTAPSWSVRSRAAPTRGGTTSTCCSRSASTRREPTTGPAPTPVDLALLAARVEEAGRLRLRGLMAVAPLGEEPERGLRAARGDP